MDVTAYLDRIGVPRATAADAATLRELHRAHQTTVPFENLSIFLDERISLAEDDLFDKIVRRRRGGFCYELNGLFAILLERLGFTVLRLGARVYGGERLGPPFDHLALLVSGADGRWLADVGFGRHSTYPLDFDSRSEQADPDGQFVLAEVADGDVEVSKDGKPQYRLEVRERELSDFAPTCWWQQTAPESHFREGTICTRITEDGRRVTLANRTLIQTEGSTRTETVLSSDSSLISAYREHFGVVLERAPAIPA